MAWQLTIRSSGRLRVGCAIIMLTRQPPLSSSVRPYQPLVFLGFGAGCRWREGTSSAQRLHVRLGWPARSVAQFPDGRAAGSFKIITLCRSVWVAPFPRRALRAQATTAWLRKHHWSGPRRCVTVRTGTKFHLLRSFTGLTIRSSGRL